MSSAYLVLGIATVVVVVILLVKFRRARVAPIIIQSPRLGLLNLKGSKAARMMAQDRSAIKSSFSSVYESTDTSPGCDVLFIYCDIDPDGRIAGTERGLRELVRHSGARVVVVASENNSESCLAAGKQTGYGRANLVLTFERKGDVFPLFYHRLFEYMAKGMTMPTAWVRLAPRIPGSDHPDCPTGLFSCEAGQVAFG